GDPFAERPKIQFCVLRHVDCKDAHNHSNEGKVSHFFAVRDGLDTSECVEEVERYNGKKVTRSGRDWRENDRAKIESQKNLIMGDLLSDSGQVAGDCQTRYQEE